MELNQCTTNGPGMLGWKAGIQWSRYPHFGNGRPAGVPHMKKRVLVTGPAGRIGVSLTEYALDRYDLRLGIRSTPMPEHLAHVPTVSLDITDPDSCRQACEGIDVVVHLAAEARR